MFHVALYQPEIPPNTGNIIRLCANTGAQLHLIHPLGFVLEDKQLRRAGLDYHEWVQVQEHADFAAFMKNMGTHRLWALTTKGKCLFHEVDYHEQDVLLFGPETRGLPDEILQQISVDQQLRIPMLSQIRSLNLSNTVAVVVYEAWRQWGYVGGG